MACAQRNTRGVQFLARQRSLLEQNLPAVVDLLLGVVSFLRGFYIELGLLPLLRQRGLCFQSVSGLGLLVGAFVLHFGGRKVPVLQHGQQLAAMHAAAAVHVKLFHRRDDFGRDGGLIAGEENSL